jgi:Cu-Zn family superoxide dismutase
VFQIFPAFAKVKESSVRQRRDHLTQLLKRGTMKTIASAACIAVFACVVVVQASGGAPSKSVTVEIKDAQGQNVGTAVLSEAPHGVKIKLDVKGLPPGEHSLHIHQNAKCEPPDFKSAGPHFNGASGHADHAGMPAGDIPDFSLIVGADGTGHATVVAPNVSMGTDDHSVFSNGGTAVVIHAVAGGTSTAAPPRIACGVISKPE